MSSDKITISMDDVNQATPVPGSTSTPFFTPGYAPPTYEPAAKPKRTGLYIGVGVAIIALLCLAGIGIAAAVSGQDGKGPVRVFHEKTVSDFRDETIRDVNAELSKPSSNLKTFIEDAHVTVTVTSANVVRCDVTTIDGTDKAGRGDSNIAQVSLLIRFQWQGILDTGYSDLRLVYDAQNDRLLKSEIEYTTALINTQDPDFWWDVGAVIGTALAL